MIILLMVLAAGKLPELPLATANHNRDVAFRNYA
jgi:hypothetical protein